MAIKKKKAKTKSKPKKKTAKKSASKKSKVKKKKVLAIPQGYHTVTPTLMVKGSAATIEFCKKAFGGKVKGLIEGPNGGIIHAVVKIGDSLLHIGDDSPTFATQSSLMLYVKNADKVLEQAIAAGATVIMPIENAFWGDRFALVQDPQGNQWQIATHIEDVSNAELKKRTKTFFAAMAKGSEA